MIGCKSLALGAAFAALIALPAAAGAEETRLDGPAIEAALADAVVVYDGAQQVFHASGVTDYFTDRPSQGRWAVRGGQYCSTWPPSDTWSCYDVYSRREGNETWLIWIGSDRSRSEGRIVANEG